MPTFTPLPTTQVEANKGGSNYKQLRMIYMAATNAKGCKGAKDTDAKIKSQRSLATFYH